MNLTAQDIAGRIESKLADRTKMAGTSERLAETGAEQGGFCSVWPTAKPVLQTIATVLKSVPGVGSTLGPIIEAMIGIVDGAFQEVCRSQQAREGGMR